MRHVDVPHPPGAVILATGDTPRYNSFFNSMIGLLVPPRTAFLHKSGNAVAGQTELLLGKALEKDYIEWVWIIGDDHTFDADILLKLLDRKKDIIIPLCLSRHGKYGPTFWVMNEKREAWMPELDELPTSGLYEAWSCGDAGMLVRREVLEATGPPWYKNISTSVKSEVHTRKGEDFYMTRNMKDKGYKLWVDLDNVMGHSMPMTAKPVVGKDGKWKRSLWNEETWVGYLTYGKAEFTAKRVAAGFPEWDLVDAKLILEKETR